MNQLHTKLVTNPALTDRQKSRIVEKLAVAEHCLIEGADEYLQIMAVATNIMKTLATVA